MPLMFVVVRDLACKIIFKFKMLLVTYSPKQTLTIQFKRVYNIKTMHKVK